MQRRAEAAFVSERLRELEQFAENREDAYERRGRQGAEPLPKAIAIHGPNLIERDASLFPAEAACWAKRVRMPAGRHWGDDRSAEVVIEFVWGNDQTGTRFSDLAAARWVKLDEIDLAATGHASGPR